MKFFLGTHVPTWLNKTDIPLFISRRTLGSNRRVFPKALGSWALDSGGFSELSMYGEWKTSKEQYLDDIQSYQEKIGNLEWVAPQDWMCEPIILKKTGHTIYEHQIETIYNFMWLRKRIGNLVIPVIQGWQLKDYQECLALYRLAGFPLEKETTVGVGSVCRRQSTKEIGNIMFSLQQEGLSLHGFGVKSQGLALYGEYLHSSDSMAWSFAARKLKILLEECTGHINCANCLKFALLWRDRLLTNNLGIE